MLSQKIKAQEKEDAIYMNDESTEMRLKREFLTWCTFLFINIDFFFHGRVCTFFFCQLTFFANLENHISAFSGICPINFIKRTQTANLIQTSLTLTSLKLLLQIFFWPYL
jgi:hypothetical protein